MALDSRLATAVLFSRFMATTSQSLLVAAGTWLERSRLGAALGGDRFVVAARGRRGPCTAVRSMSGRGQSRATALVAAVSASSVLAREVPAGVHHLELLPVNVVRIESLATRGLVFGRELGGVG